MVCCQKPTCICQRERNPTGMQAETDLNNLSQRLCAQTQPSHNATIQALWGGQDSRWAPEYQRDSRHYFNIVGTEKPACGPFLKKLSNPVLPLANELTAPLSPFSYTSYCMLEIYSMLFKKEPLQWLGSHIQTDLVVHSCNPGPQTANAGRQPRVPSQCSVLPPPENRHWLLTVLLQCLLFSQWQTR